MQLLLSLLLTLSVNSNASSLPGSLDLGFQAPKLLTYLFGMALRSDGKIVVCPQSYGDYYYGLVLLDTNGSFISRFGTNWPVYGIIATPDAKFIANISAETIKLIKLTAAGTRDTSFNTSPIANNRYTFTLVQSDGKVLLGGDNFVFGTNVYNGVIRLNADGSVDTAYNPELGPNDEVSCGALQADGKLVFGGDFTSVNEIVTPYIARFNQDGSLDGTFHPELFTPRSLAHITTISIQSDQRIVITGSPRCVSQCFYPCTARLNSDGSWDGSFVQLSVDGYIKRSLVQQNDKIIFLGGFALVNTNPAAGIFRINTDGSHDGGYKAAAVHPNSIEYSLLQTNGQVIVGGMFTSVDKRPLSTLVRLNGDAPQVTLSNPTYSQHGGFYAKIQTHPGASVTVQTSSNLSTWSQFTSFTSTNWSADLIDSNASLYDKRFYRVFAP